ncbi:MAG: hypothetical protein WBC69_13855 [Geitlerinemataceae cyanobacterium]
MEPNSRNVALLESIAIDLPKKDLNAHRSPIDADRRGSVKPNVPEKRDRLRTGYTENTEPLQLPESKLPPSLRR